MKARIKPYKEAYWTEVRQVFLRNTPTYFHPEELADLRHYLDREAQGYFVLNLKGQIVGSGGYCLSGPGLGRLAWDFLDPEFRGQGLGTLLIAHCLHRLNADFGVRSVEVYTSQLAWRFYERFGFELRRKEKDYWARDLDLYYMVKDAEAPPSAGKAAT